MIRLPLNKTSTLVYALSRVAQTGWSKDFFSTLLQRYLTANVLPLLEIIKEVQYRLSPGLRLVA